MSIQKTALVTGASGFVGGNLCRELVQHNYRVIGLFREHTVADAVRSILFKSVQADITDKDSVDKLFLDDEIDCVVHAAALAEPVRAEEDPDLTWQTNVIATKHLAGAMSHYAPEAQMIYLSTDLVFDGYRGNQVPPGGFREQDLPKPISIYSRSKLRAEELMLGKLEQSCVLRLSLVFGPAVGNRAGVLGWMREAFEREAEVSLFVDEYRTPLAVGDVAAAVLAVDKNRPKSSRVFHLAGPERMNRLAFGERIADFFGYNKALIHKCSRMKMEARPPRPEDVSLCNSAASEILGISFANLETALGAL